MTGVKKYVSAANIVITLLCLTCQVHAQRHIELLDRSMDYFSIVSQMEQERAAGKISDREYKQFKRWEMNVVPYVDGSGKLLNSAAKNFEEYTKYRRSHPVASSNLRAVHGNWTTISPGSFTPDWPANGRLNCIAVHPTDPNIIYVGAAFGGVWRTTNGGTTWNCLTDGLPVTGISSIAINYENPANIYIATGDADGRHVPSMGILESHDGGLSWVKTGLEFNLPELIYAYKLLMHPTNPDSMFLATTQGIYITGNGWQTWDVHASDDSWRDLEFKPDAPDTIYAANSNTVYRSTSGGSSWTSLGGSATGLPFPSGFTRVALAVSPANPDFVGAVYTIDVEEGNGFQGLYASFDNAEQFYLMSDMPNIVGAIDYNQTAYDLSFASDPTDASKLFVGGVQLWYSLNYGVAGTWLQIANGGTLDNIHPDIHAILHQGWRILVATDGGIVKSTDGGASWTNISDGLNIMQFYDIDVRLSTSSVIGGTQDNGTNMWDIGNAQGDWIQGGDGFEVMFDPSDINIIYASTQNDRLRSDNGGASFINITPPTDSSHWDASWIMHPTNPDTLYCAWQDLSRTYDRGDTWTHLNTNFNTSEPIRAMAQSPSDPDVMYLSNRVELRYSPNIHDSSPNFWNRSSGLPLADTLQLGGIAVDPSDPDRVWITLRGYVDGEKVYYSSNQGYSGTWTNVSGTLPNVPVFCIAYRPGSNDGLYIGTYIGVFYKNANMADWIYFGNGLPTTLVQDLRVTENYVFAGTFGRGIWWSPHYSACPVSLSLTPGNDPSPANSTGTQHYSASSSILSTRIITGGVGTDVTYQAGGYIRLTPGFHVKSYNKVSAVIAGCPE